MNNDLSNKEKAIYDYMKELLKESFPDVDLSDDGAFMETFGVPHIEILNPLIEYGDRLTLMQSLENASIMTHDEMDEVGLRYYIRRDSGERAAGNVILSFSDIPTDGTLIVPAGTEVISKQGSRYRSMETQMFSEGELVNYYDPDTFKYRVPIFFEALESGEDSNAAVGDVTTVTSNLSNLESAYNDVEIRGGRDRQSNEEYAESIREGVMAPNLGNKRGYNRYIKGFEGVEDLVVAGYGHPLMKRDIIGTFPNSGFLDQEVRDLHWGTKIDIYIRGRVLETETEHVKVETLPNGKGLGVRLKKSPVYDIVDIKLYADYGELDDPNINSDQLYISDYVLLKDESFETVGTLEENSFVVISDNRVDESLNVRVRYRYNKLVREIHEDMYTDDQRPPTADVKIKEARPKYVFGSVTLGMVGSVGVRPSDIGDVRHRVHEWVSSVKMDEELQFSDVADVLTRATRDDEPSPIEYLNLPFKFIVTDNNSKYIYYCMSEEQRKLVSDLKTEIPFLYDVFSEYGDKVTVNDFFDLLHLMTFNSGLDQAMKEIGFQGYDWGLAVQAFQECRKIVGRTLTTELLSPAVTSTNTHEYMELGEVVVYDDVKYTTNDWKQGVLLFKSISGVTDENSDHNKLMRLAVYCVSIVFLLTHKGDKDELPDDLYEYIMYAIDRTPIAHEMTT